MLPLELQRRKLLHERYFNSEYLRNNWGTQSKYWLLFLTIYTSNFGLLKPPNDRLEVVIEVGAKNNKFLNRVVHAYAALG